MSGAYSRYVGPSSLTPNDDVLVTCDAAVAVRDALYLEAADLYGRANATSMATMPVAGFVVSKPTPTSALMRTSGDLGGFTLAADTEYFANIAAGGITSAPPVVAGQVQQSVGRAKDATTLTISIVEGGYTVL